MTDTATPPASDRRDTEARRTRVAVVGAGIAGLSAAYALRRDCQVTVYESDSRAGGHANSVEVSDGDQILGLETAFAVYNEPHYPRVTAFFAELGTPTLAHVGGFSFFDKSEGWRYTSEDLETSGESPMDNDRRLSIIKAEAKRFYEETPRHFIRGGCDLSMGDYLDREKYSDEFKYGFLMLICSAAWSVPAAKVWEMSASVVVAFFWGHGEGGLGGRSVEWRTVAGGSTQYVRRALTALRGRGNDVLLDTPVLSVREMPDAVEVTTSSGVELFDQVVMATHLDDSLQIVEGLTPSRRALLDLVGYNTTRVCLHTDASVMPSSRDDWRSWNYGRTTTGGEIQCWVVYYLNQLQGFDAQRDYFTTLDYPGDIRDDAVIATFDYRHPVISHAVRTRQDNLRAASLEGRVKFCGGYLHSRKVGKDILGMHESAFDAGLQAAESIQSGLDVKPSSHAPTTTVPNR